MSEEIDEETSESLFEDDYYAFLNVPRDATQEQIQEAYRRQSKIYHPDKHLDEALKKDAEIMFNRTKKAYEILVDPHKRAIYDTVGVRGLETTGWEVVQRTKTPHELREEFERLEREREERRLELCTNPVSNVTVKINATDMFTKYGDDEVDSWGGFLSSVEVSAISFEQSIEAPLTIKDTAILQGDLTVKNGIGSGSINASVRHQHSTSGWFEAGFGAGNGPVVSFKGYRRLTRRIFFDGAIVMEFNTMDIRPGFIGTLAMQLDTDTVGYLTYRVGLRPGINTTIVRGTPYSYTAFSIELSLIRSYINLSYTYNMREKQLKFRGCVRGGTFGAFVEYGLEKKVSNHTSISTMVHVGIPTGVILRLKLTRSFQTYSFPIRLSEEVFPAPVFYATVAPLFTWTLLKNFVIDPIAQKREEQSKEKQREVNKQLMAEKQKEAKAAIDLMRATFSRIRAEEERKMGLVITKALYGRFVYPQESSNEQRVSGHRDEIIDVTIPLQCLVKDSKLVLHNASKRDLPGFYDPSVGEDKQLLVQYLFHEQAHECLIKDTETLRIPKQTHRVNIT